MTTTPQFNTITGTVNAAAGTYPTRVGNGWEVWMRNASYGHALAADPTLGPTYPTWIPDHAIIRIDHPTLIMLAILNGGELPGHFEDEPCLCGVPELEHFTRTGSPAPWTVDGCAVIGKGQQ